MDKKFIVTNSPDTYAFLKKLGFEEISNDNKNWYFLNTNKIMFSSDDLKGATFTDILHF